MLNWLWTWNPLSRLEGIETVDTASYAPSVCAWNPLSRLEGIETQVTALFVRILTILEIRFPVWRELKRIWNGEVKWGWAWNPLSRLEGIETRFVLWSVFTGLSPLEIRFPVWRELKLFFPCLGVRYLLELSRITWNPLSRLEGIETTFQDSVSKIIPVLSWNPLSRLEGIETMQAISVGRWRSFGLKSAFPFGGNWNIDRYPNATQRICISWNPLSRLEGIETMVTPIRGMNMFSWNPLSRLEGIETNPKHHVLWRLKNWLEIRFPVWRELKRTHNPIRTDFFCPLTWNPLSRLEGMETQCRLCGYR